MAAFEPRGGAPKEDAPPEGPPTAPPPPVRWPYVALGFGLSFSAAVACLIALAIYLQSRPIDLRAPTYRHITAVQQHLLSAGLPPAAVQGAEPEFVDDGAALWFHARIEAELPEGVSAAGLERLLTREMTLANVAVYDETPPGGDSELSLHYANRELARVILRSPPPPPPEPRIASCGALRAEVEALLARSGLPWANVAHHDGPSPDWPEETEPAPEGWIAAELAEPADLDALFAMLSAELDDMPVTFGSLAAPMHDQHRAFVLAFDGAPCLVLAAAPSLEMAEAEDLARPEWLDAPANGEANGEDPNGGAEAALNPPGGNGEERENVEETPLDEAAATRSTSPANPVATGLRAAIIVDDGGYGGPRTEVILASGLPLTLAILPYTPQGEDIARRAVEAGFEVMLHMPMEAKNFGTSHPGELRTEMTPEEIYEFTWAALETVPGAVGVNNHMGSKFTGDAPAMRAFIDAIAGASLYFVDSRTTAKTHGERMAREAGVATARRHVFLDHKPDPEYIRNQFERFIRHCRTEGEAIAIGHFQTAFADILEELAARLEEEGIELVPVSEIVQ